MILAAGPWKRDRKIEFHYESVPLVVGLSLAASRGSRIFSTRMHIYVEIDRERGEDRSQVNANVLFRLWAGPHLKYSRTRYLKEFDRYRLNANDNDSPRSNSGKRLTKYRLHPRSNGDYFSRVAIV